MRPSLSYNREDNGPAATEGPGRQPSPALLTSRARPSAGSRLCGVGLQPEWPSHRLAASTPANLDGEPALPGERGHRRHADRGTRPVAPGAHPALRLQTSHSGDSSAEQPWALGDPRAVGRRLQPQLGVETRSRQQARSGSPLVLGRKSEPCLQPDKVFPARPGVCGGPRVSWGEIRLLIPQPSPIRLFRP